MRIRTVKPEFFHSSKIRSLEYETRLLFVGLWCFADDAGRFENDPQLIKSLIFPSDDLDVAKKLRRLEKENLIKRYRVRKKEYFVIPGWSRHQRINRPSEPRTPPPISRSPHRRKPRTRTHGALIERSPGKGREGKGKEGEKSLARSGDGVVRQDRARSERAISSNGPEEKTTGEGAAQVPGAKAGNGVLALLELYLPHASIERLMRSYPTERLQWAAEVTRAAHEARRVEKPASYLLRILRDDDQWERCICDQYALGRARALKRQKELAAKKLRHEEVRRKREREIENAAFKKYMRTIPEPIALRIRNSAVARWTDEHGVDIEAYRRGGWFKQASQAIYEEHVYLAWRALGKPKRNVLLHGKVLDAPPQRETEGGQK